MEENLENTNQTSKPNGEIVNLWVKKKEFVGEKETVNLRRIKFLGRTWTFKVYILVNFLVILYLLNKDTNKNVDKIQEYGAT